MKIKKIKTVIRCLNDWYKVRARYCVEESAKYFEIKYEGKISRVVDNSNLKSINTTHEIADFYINPHIATTIISRAHNKLFTIC